MKDRCSAENVGQCVRCNLNMMGPFHGLPLFFTLLTLRATCSEAVVDAVHKVWPFCSPLGCLHAGDDSLSIEGSRVLSSLSAALAGIKDSKASSPEVEIVFRTSSGANKQRTAIWRAAFAVQRQVDPRLLPELVRQWQKAIQEQMQLEQECAKKKQVPVWRCAACGRYGCPVAPYIETYQEI
eukprot:1138506-Pelagomonas_calceolata.AAC.17